MGSKKGHRTACVFVRKVGEKSPHRGTEKTHSSENLDLITERLGIAQRPPTKSQKMILWGRLLPRRYSRVRSWKVVGSDGTCGP